MVTLIRNSAVCDYTLSRSNHVEVQPLMNGPMIASLTEPSSPKPLSYAGGEVRYLQSNVCFAQLNMRREQPARGAILAVSGRYPLRVGTVDADGFSARAWSVIS